MYEKELELVEDFQNYLSHNSLPFKFNDTAVEFNYINGRVDIIGSTHDGELFAFEAKLSKWKIALNQAYRNTAFAHYSYVLIPFSKINAALKNQYEFERRGVGLCSFQQNQIKIEIEATRKTPIQPWLTDSAMSYIESK